MNLKRIEMIGFKSFADKTKIEFYDGVTGIVGPNGSGKSNVSDAVKWVFGEQKKEETRTNKMLEVIFHGTKARNPLSYCEVNLVFDNTNRIFDIEYDELVISRKLYRSGENNYYLNKIPCRLKDITALLHSTGLGKDGYSIIGQNRVSQLINSKPMDRRKIFEEAAGIGKFKQTKAETEKKLAKANENLGILQNMIAEIEYNLNPLKKQAIAAQKYLELGEQCKKYDINNYIYQYDSANDQKETIQTKINAIQEEKNAKQSSLNEVILEYSENNESIEKIDGTVSKLYNQKVDLNVRLERKSGETNIIKERINAVEEDIKRLSIEISNSQNEKSLLTEELVQKTNLLANSDNKIASLTTEYESTNEQYSSLLEELLENKSNTVSSQKNIMDTFDKLSDVKSSIAKYTAEKESLISLIADVKVKQNQLNLKYEEDKLEETSLTQQLQTLINDKNLLKEKEKNALLLHNDSMFKMNVKDENIQNSLQNVYTLQSRLKMLEDLQKDFVGYAYGVQNLLKQSKFNEILKQKFEGVVASLIDVDPKFRKAIEVALGSSAQNIVTTNSEDVKYLINFLKSNNMGQATFLPINSVKRRSLSNEEQRFLSSKGCLGLATNFVKCDKKYEPIINSLLGSTVICEDHNTMINMAESAKYSFRIVSLEGDIVSTTGAITGGSSKSKTSNIIGREQEIEETKKLLQKFIKEQDTLKTEKQELANLISKISEELKLLSSQIHEIDVSMAKIKENIQNISILCIDDEEQLKILSKQYLEIDKQIKILDMNILQVSEIQKNLSENKEFANENMESNQMKSEILNNQKDSFNDKITEIKVNLSSLNSEILSLKEDIERLNSELVEVDERLVTLEEEKNIKVQAKDNLLKQIEVKYQEKGYAELKQLLDETDTKIKSLEEYKKSLQINTKKLDEQRTYLQDEIARLVSKENEQEIKKATVDVQLQNMEDIVWKQYELTYGTCQEYRIEDYDLAKGIVEAERLKKEMDKLGNINHNAITDAENLQKRYDETFENLQDLLESKDKLTEIIDTTSKDMEEKFNTEFKKINDGFGEVYRELFGGGNARLVLQEPDEDSDDPFQRGVEIIAEPPGKKFTNISLLSGGEQALTGIAILFAILKLKPMPFVLLDEVDAALDDANIVRFAKYLNRFKNSTQFIVITHRKPTMELCDRLYGVTLQNTVSIVVSIKLAEAIRLAEKEAQ